MSNLELAVEEIRNIMGDGCTVSLREVEKNNGVKKIAVIIREDGKNISPCIYASDDAIEDMGVRKFAEHAVNVYKQAKSDPVDDVNFTDKDFILKNVKCELIGTYANMDSLPYIPHKSFLDLTIVYYVDVVNDDGMKATFRVKNAHMTVAEIDFEELDKAATQNTLKDGVELIDMEKIMMNMALGIGMPHGGKIEDADFGNANDLRLHVLTSGNTYKGAIFMMYPEVLRRIADAANGDFYILPSSIHEVIIVKAGDPLTTAEDLRSMVMHVNGDQNAIEKTEILTNSVYIYRAKEERLEIA